MNAPCKGCIKRDYPKCYEKCEPYIAYRAERNMIADKRYMENIAFYKPKRTERRKK